MPIPHREWKSPYDGIPESDRARLNIGVSPDDMELLRSSVPVHGFFSLAIQTFIHDIATYVRTNDLSYGNRDQIINYVRQRADSRFTEETTTRDERSGTEGVHEDPSSSPDLRANVQQAHKGGRKGRKQAK